MTSASPKSKCASPGIPRQDSRTQIGFTAITGIGWIKYNLGSPRGGFSRVKHTELKLKIYSNERAYPEPRLTV